MATTKGGSAAVYQPGEVQVRRALLTVSDKRGLVDFARGLAELGVEIVSTSVPELACCSKMFISDGVSCL